MKKLSFILLVFFYAHTAFSQLTGIIPSSGQLGQQLTTTITSTGFFQFTASPSGNIRNVIFRQGANVIQAYDQTTTAVLHPDSLSTELTIPVSAVTGLYDVVVTDLSFTTYTLPAAFDIVPADGNAEGTIYYDLNDNGTQDVGEPGISGETVSSQNGVSVTTDVNGNFSIPLANGNYTISRVPSSLHGYLLTSDSADYTITINNGNVTGLNFGLKDGLYGMTPSNGHIGQNNLNATVQSHGLFQTGANPWGNITQAYLIYGTFLITIPLADITVLNSNQAQLLFDIPQAQQQATYSLVIQTGAIQYYQVQAFTVGPAPSNISGTVYHDANQNGVFDIGESPVPNQRVCLGPDSAMVFSDASGNYVFATSLGSKTVSYCPADTFFTQTSSPSTYSFTTTGDTSGIDFGLYLNTLDYTSTVQLLPGFMRCNTVVWCTIRFKNTSNVTTDGTIWLLMSSNLTFISSTPTVTTQNGDTLFWDFTGLAPLETRTIVFGISVPGVGSTVSLYCNMVVNDLLGNAAFTTDDDFLSGVSCSYDPNDKACDPPGVDDVMHYTLFSDTLEYLIRFQNSGNDTAFNIYIRDTIDASLDLNTIELLEVSHNVQLAIDSNRAALFTFNNILLPDSNVDEPGSHGYILYRIRPKSGLPDPTRVENRAFIYFDLNPPIETNTTWNTLVAQIPTSVSHIPADDNGVRFYPNPMNSTGTFFFLNDKREEYRLDFMDINGRIVFTKSASINQIAINRGDLSAGIYLYRLMNMVTGKTHTGKIIVD